MTNQEPTQYNKNLMHELRHDQLIFKTTAEILSAVWNQHDFNLNTLPNYHAELPDKQSWLHRNDLTFDKVRVWETLYYKGGVMGMYAAWDPYAEFFVITHNLFLDSPAGIEIFYGPGAIRQFYNRAKELGVELPIGPVWVDPEHLTIYDHFN